jgi:hypothetical protein
MNDKEILAEVYSKLEFAVGGDAGCAKTIRRNHIRAIRRFIEQEWQKADDQELADQHNRNREAKTGDWYGWQAIGFDPDPCTTDVKEIERHRGLEIGEDGTVKKIL